MSKTPIRSPEERNKLIEPLLPPQSDWVKSIILLRYPQAKANRDFYDDLLSAGYQALIDAGDTWQPPRGQNQSARFRHYAWIRVRSYCRKVALEARLGPVHVPSYVSEAEMKAEKRLTQGTAKSWTAKDKYPEDPVALPVATPEDLLIVKEDRATIESALVFLPERRAQIVRDFYGLGTGRAYSAKMLAAEYKVSPRVIWQELRQARKQLSGLLGQNNV